MDVNAAETHQEHKDARRTHEHDAHLLPRERRHSQGQISDHGAVVTYDDYLARGRTEVNRQNG